MNRVKFYAERKPWHSGISIHMGAHLEGGAMNVAQPVVMQQAKHGELSQPFMSLDMESAQLLIDELWNCGLRPTEGTGSAGSLAATERHLEDMRRLVFKSGHQPAKKGGAS